MKKNYFLFIVFAFMSMQMVYAQSFSKDELKKYSGQGNKSDVARAAELAQENPLNDQYELVLSCVKEYSGQSKKELYNKIYNWIINLSSNSQSAIQVADTAKWIIQTRCNIQQIAKRTMGDNRYKVNIRPLLTFDFKDEKIRFTFNLQSYDWILRWGRTKERQSSVATFRVLSLCKETISSQSHIVKSIS